MSADSTEKTLARLRKVGHTASIVPVTIDDEIFYVRSLTGAARHALLVKREQSEVKLISSADWAAAGLCEEDGTLVFPNDRAGAEHLGQLDSRVVEKLAAAVIEVSAVGEAASKN